MEDILNNALFNKNAKKEKIQEEVEKLSKSKRDLKFSEKNSKKFKKQEN